MLFSSIFRGISWQAPLPELTPDQLESPFAGDVRALMARGYGDLE
jgi:hypothetical protein